MSSQSSPVVLRYKRKQSPSAGIVVAVLVAFLILFWWLHLILAQKIESAGREIQVRTEELHRIERHNHELRRQISIAGSQERMAERSERMGYTSKRPIYLLVDQALPPSTQTSPPGGQNLAGILGDSVEPAYGHVTGSPLAGSSGGE